MGATVTHLHTTGCHLPQLEWTTAVVNAKQRWMSLALPGPTTVLSVPGFLLLQSEASRQHALEVMEARCEGRVREEVDRAARDVEQAVRREMAEVRNKRNNIYSTFV